MGILNLREIDDGPPSEKQEKQYTNLNERLFKKKVCITGKIPGYTRRSFSNMLTNSFQCTVEFNVTKRIDYLIVGMGALGNSKVRKAYEYGIYIINYKDIINGNWN